MQVLLVAREGVRRREAEAALAVIEPELVGVLEVVADVEVGGAVTVHVVEAGGEREEVGLGRQRHAARVAESCATDRHVLELPAADVQEEEVGIGALRADDPAEVGAVLDAVLLLPLRLHRVARRRLRHHLVEHPRLRRIGVERVPHLVGRDVEVEVAVAVHVGERERGGRVPAHESARGGPVGEVALAVVQEELHRTAERADEEVEVAVAVHVRHHRAGAGEAVGGETAFLRHVAEAQAAEIAIEARGLLHRGEEEVGIAIAVHVADRRAGADEQVAIGERVLVVHAVLVGEPGAVGAQLGEAGARTGRGARRLRHVERAPAESVALLPRTDLGRRLAAGSGEDHTGDQRPAASEVQGVVLVFSASTRRATHSPWTTPSSTAGT